MDPFQMLTGARRQAGLSQHELAWRAGTSRPTSFCLRARPPLAYPADGVAGTRHDHAAAALELVGTCSEVRPS